MSFLKQLSPNSPKDDVLSGLTVALALVPEAVAFALIAQVTPLVGLYAAFIIGLITSIFGGRPGMISGATGAIAVVLVSLVVQHGVEYLFAAVILMGILQMLFGVLQLGKFIRLVPYPVFLGFVNGLALVIFLAQINQFKVVDGDGTSQWIQGTPLLIMLVLVAATMAVIHFLPKFTKAVPSTLVAIVVLSLIVVLLGIETRTVGDIAPVAGDLPSFHIPTVPFTWETFRIILPYAVIMALVGLIESLLTLNLVDALTETRGQANRESMAQGLANFVTGLFGGMGGCAMVGQSIININSGGSGRLSGITAALALLAIILLGAPLIEKIPVAVLVGVMFMVVIGTFKWSSLRLFGRVPHIELGITAVVMITTVMADLAVAVILGVILSALVFAWDHAKVIRVEKYVNDGGNTVYELIGPIFFASIHNFQELFTPNDDEKDVIIDFKRSRVADHSALEAIDQLAERYERADRRLHLVHLSPECRLLLKKAGDLVEVNVLEDPMYSVAAGLTDEEIDAYAARSRKVTSGH
ncbi:MAG: sodium-independent anion transporter [Proteobacteria bacterium]|nr:MAG: sodium-independent anion transporter [Pseudomonadota bacterium]